MDEYQPTKDELIEERLKEVADLFGLSYEEYQCELHFQRKTGLFDDNLPGRKSGKP